MTQAIDQRRDMTSIGCLQEYKIAGGSQMLKPFICVKYPKAVCYLSK